MMAVTIMSIIGRLFCILTGALAVSVLVTGIVLVPVGHWYENNHARSFNDVADAYVLSLALQAIAAVVGGWLGNRLFRMWRQRRASR